MKTRVRTAEPLLLPPCLSFACPTLRTFFERLRLRHHFRNVAPPSRGRGGQRVLHLFGPADMERIGVLFCSSDKVLRELIFSPTLELAPKRVLENRILVGVRIAVWMELFR